VYVCVEDGGAFAKVGWTSSPEGVVRRLESLRTGNPRALEMRVVGPGGRATEAAFHAAFAAQHVQGEWFRIEGPVEKLIQASDPLARRSSKELGRPRTKREAAIEWLRAELANGPAGAGAVFAAAQAAGHSVKTVRRAAAELGVVRTPPGGGRNCSWQLREAEGEATTEPPGAINAPARCASSVPHGTRHQRSTAAPAQARISSMNESVARRSSGGSSSSS